MSLSDHHNTTQKLTYKRQHQSCLLYNSNPEFSGWEALANAIIEQAAKDYRDYSRIYYKNKRSEKGKNAAAELIALERFFTSEWFAQLTDIDGSWLLDQLQEEVENGHIKKNHSRTRPGH